MENIKDFTTLPADIDKEWAVKELKEFLEWVGAFQVDDTRSYSKTHQKAYDDWYQYLHEKLNQYDFVNGKPEENTVEKRPKAVFWWCVYKASPQFYIPSSKELKEQMENIIKDAISYITRKNLKDWLPYDFEGGIVDNRIFKHLGDEVDQEFGGMDETRRRWIGKHKNVHVWCTLKTGYAVAWNESPARGWAFVIVPLKEKQ